MPREPTNGIFPRHQWPFEYDHGWLGFLATMRISGHIDNLTGGELRGWARDRWFPRRRLMIDVFERGIFIGQTIAAFYREDLDNGGSNDGFHGFRMRFPPSLGAVAVEDIRARVSRYPDAWLKCPDGTTRPPDSSRRTRLHRLDHTFGAMLDLIEDAADRLGIAPLEGTALDGLFDQAPGVAWPLSAFAWHIAQKFGRAGDGSPTRARYEAFVAWYLSDYALAKAPDRLPLSQDEIAYWSARSPTGAEWVTTLLQRHVLRGDWGDHAAHAIWMEDCLVDSATLAAARATAWPWDRWQVFPLSRFMVQFQRTNADIARLPTARAKDRQLLYALIMLHGLRSPHILGFLPSKGLRAMLDTSNGESLFTKTLAKTFPRRAAISASAYARQVLARGFDVANQSWRPLRRGNHRSSHGTKPLGVGVYDVQIIGPFRRTLGLAESCHRLASMMARLPYSLNLVDYDLGNDSTTSDCMFELGVPSIARINILHLNLEEIPEALAFMPEVFSSAYNVAFPYWELNAPSACHRLGLALVDEIWAASTFLDTVFRRHAKTTTAIGMCINQNPLVTSRAEGRQLLSDLGVAAEDFAFLAISDALSWVQRKNVLGAIEAFLNAHSADAKARLIVKTHNRHSGLSASQHAFWAKVETLCASDPRIILVNETFDARKQSALIHGADCLVSLHRAEGLGLDILEAMRLGVAVIATAYGGATDACTTDTSWLVEADVVAVPPEDYAFVEPGHVWADPCLKAASRLMRDVMNDSAQREQRCAAAREHIASRFGANIVGERIERRVSTLLKLHPRSV